jgi:hypothetical protein
MEVDDNILLIVGDPQGIPNQQLKPRTIHLPNVMSHLVANLEVMSPYSIHVQTVLFWDTISYPFALPWFNKSKITLVKSFIGTAQLFLPP